MKCHSLLFLLAFFAGAFYLAEGERLTTGEAVEQLGGPFANYPILGALRVGRSGEESLVQLLISGDNNKLLKKTANALVA
jgi:hypothetical protein